MFKFLRALTGESEVAQSNDNVILDETTNYLHFDVEDNNTVKRVTVHAPTSATATSYSNTTSGSSATTAQGAIDDLYANKVTAVSGKGLSTEDYTTAEQTKLGGIETGAEVNTIETVKVNGVALSPDSNKAVDVTVPTTFAASAVTSGVFDIERIPRAALERLVMVANQAARYQLTSDDVDLGDVIKEQDTGMMYYVVNLLALDSALGYEEFTAGTASSVPWSGVTNKPDFSAEIAVTLLASGWSAQNTYTITNSAITATVSGYLGIATSATVAQREAARDAMICITSQTDGTLVLTADADEAPSVDIPVVITLLAD